MITARNAAMAFNRYIDAEFDAKNPRTAIREIPKGIISRKSALFFILINMIAFMAAAYGINMLCFILSPVALLVVLGYSLTKRFTFLCHLVLGLGLSLAPVGAYLAVTGQFSLTAILLGITVLFWVAGFDIIYALQDEDFDKENQLFSIPAYLGRAKSLWLSRFLHLISASVLIVVMYILSERHAHITWITFAGMAIFIVMLFYQHTLVKVNDLSRVNLAFFTTNGIASLIIGSFFIIDILLL